MAEDVRRIANDVDDAPADIFVQRFSPAPMGTRIGDFVIQSVLGAGDLGITYVAVHEGRDRRVALKEYFPRAIAFRDGPTVRVSSASTPNYAWGLDRFLTDARALTRVRHTSIVQVQSVLESNGTGYAVMSLVQGRDLGIWLHELRRPPMQAELDKIFTPLTEGLAAAHARDLLHQDITPACIIIQDSGTPVLVDFGAARVATQRRLNIQPAAELRP